MSLSKTNSSLSCAKYNTFISRKNCNQDPHSQTENDETPGVEYINKNDSEDTETNKTYATFNFMPQTLADDKIVKRINSLYSNLRKVFNMVHTWAKIYVKHNGHIVEPI